MGLKLAVSGKGGVGKTTLAGTLARLWARRGFKVLAIDQDPNPNLAAMLGVPRRQAANIVAIAENEELIEEKTGVPQSSHGVHPAVYHGREFTVDDIVERFCVRAPDAVSLLVVGEVEHAGAGCMCAAHRVIRSLTEHLVLDREEMVVMDMEAGVEHLSRGTAMHVDAMLALVEPYLKSLETAGRIDTLARELGIKTVHVVGNKVQSDKDRKMIERFCAQKRLAAKHFVPYDESVLEAGKRGAAPLDAARDSPAIASMQELAVALTQPESAA